MIELLDHEFLAISDAKEFSREEAAGWMEYVSREKEQEEWDLYYVLLVQKGQNFWRRLGLGKIFEAFGNSEATWKEIITG